MRQTCNPAYSEGRTVIMVQCNIRTLNTESTTIRKFDSRSISLGVAMYLIGVLVYALPVEAQQASPTDPNKISVSLLMLTEGANTAAPNATASTNPTAPAIARREISKLTDSPTLRTTSSPTNRLRMLEALGISSDRVATPANATKLIALPKLSVMEIADLGDRLELYLSTTLSYRTTPPKFVETLPMPPKGINGIRTMARIEGTTVHVIQFGTQRFVSQPPQCWVLGLIVNEDNTLAENPVLADIESTIPKMLASLNDMRKAMSVRDLETKVVQLSYVDAKMALSMLKGMGITVFDKPESIPPKIDFAQLPYVISIEDPKPGDTGLIGADAKMGQGKLSLTPGTAGKITENAVAGPMTQLMVMFHPAHPGQFSDVRHMLDTFIDRPARQIFIEGMVLEISEKGLKDLGVNWKLLNTDFMTLEGGATNDGGTLLSAGHDDVTSSLDVTIPKTSDFYNVFRQGFPWDWKTTIRALIRTGKAEILSRPSVLTLNNRQSTIRVGQDIPMLSSSEGTSYNSNKLKFEFSYLSTGILLNIRPRINEAGTEVSMLIDTIVSAQVPGEDLQVLSSNNSNQVLASAPTISTRRVQTYGRIRNNTPFIIGGLVAREKTSIEDKIPLLGDLPWVGGLFRAQKSEMLKREVIIVLTPYILPEEKLIPRSLPKDEDLFDSFGHELFRDSYRIRAEDVFDLTFLLENARIVSYRSKARRAVTKNFRLGETEPFRTFAEESIPGEPILVTRMIYEVIKRLSLDAPVLSDRIIYLQSQQDAGGYNVQFLETFLDGLTGGDLKKMGSTAVAITFIGDPSDQDSPLNTQSTPEVTVIECADRKAWGRLLWELNQPLADGTPRHTVLIQDESDVVRLRRAMTLKKIITLNGGSDQMLLKNFSVGKVLLMPELREDQTHLIDTEAAMFFYYTEHYYAESLKVIEEQLNLLEAELQKPSIKILIESE